MAFHSFGIFLTGRIVTILYGAADDILLSVTFHLSQLLPQIDERSISQILLRFGFKFWMRIDSILHGFKPFLLVKY